VLEYFADKGYAKPVTRIGMPTDSFVEHGTIAELQKLYGMDVEGIRKCIMHNNYEL
jgi:1-deoxy-D-xylulose-5-phosphate synthase